MVCCSTGLLLFFLGLTGCPNTRTSLTHFLSLPTEAIFPSFYLTGVGQSQLLLIARNNLLSQLLRAFQNQVPVIHPVRRLFERTDNQTRSLVVKSATRRILTSLTREDRCLRSDHRPAGEHPNSPLCNGLRRSALARLPAQCLLRGIPRKRTRGSRLRRSGGGRSTDPAGEIWNGRLRASARMRIDCPRSRTSPAFSNFLPVGDTQGVAP